MSNLPPSSLLKAGSRLGQYELIRTAGTGGMGVVYLARDPDLDRNVAIKLLHPPTDQQAPGADPAERFLREARAAARINHPNAVAIYQVGRHEGLIFIAMEWVDGGSLAEHLRHNVFLDWREATAAIRDAAAGLGAAHKAGIVHRDLKPANLMRTTTGSVKVTDFGLARALDVASDLTCAGTILGTPTYLSPEQCRGESATLASDVYSLACTYFHLLTSRPPFAAANLPGLLHCHLSSPFPDARKFAEEVPESVLAILDRGTRKNPAERYPDANAMLRDLDAALAGQTARSPMETAVIAPPSELLLTEPASRSLLQTAVGAPPVSLDTPSTPAPNNLPLPQSSFVGRQRELAQAKALLAEHRLITLIGPGGTGKTRLSCELGREALTRFPEGVWSIELAGVAAESAGAAEAVVQALATVLSVRAAANQTLLPALIDFLRPKRCLLLLDNCEHLIDASAALCAAILLACPQVRVLATSRQALGCAGEIEMRVPPLEAPPSGIMMPPAELAKIDAVRLFVDRAAQARPGYAVTADNGSAISDICRRLDGIPLAIELAAARVKVLSAQQIAERLDDAFKLLTTGSRTLLPRQRTLRALIDWSYELLSPEERTLFARLAVFGGSCALESAEAIAAGTIGGGGEIEEWALLDLLGELVDQSLVVMDERQGAARYRMLETIRQYAAEKLDASGERAVLEARHLAHFSELLHRALPELSGPDQGAWLARLDLERDNVRAALDRAKLPESKELVLTLAASMNQYWLMRGFVMEGLARCKLLIDTGAVDHGSAAAARVLNGAAIFARYRGESAAARACAERGLTMAQTLGDPELECLLTNNLGTLARDAGDIPRAREMLGRVLEVRRTLGEAGAIADAANNLGIMLMKMPGQVDIARTLLQEALAGYEQTGNTSWIGYANLNLGELENDAGQTASARERYATSLRILEGVADEWGIAYALEGLGKCDVSDGELTTARSRFERALILLRKLGDRPGLAIQLDRLAQLALKIGDSAAAWPMARESLAIRLETGDQLGLAESMEILAGVRREADPARAATLLGGADAIRRRMDMPIPPAQRSERTALLDSLRAELGDEAFHRAFESGAALKPGDPAILG